VIAGLGWAAAEGGQGVESGPANGETTGRGEWDTVGVAGPFGVPAGGLVTVAARAAGPAQVAAATNNAAAVRATVRACGRRGNVDSIVGQGTHAVWTVGPVILPTLWFGGPTRLVW
jgi:hypothetical protein